MMLRTLFAPVSDRVIYARKAGEPVSAEVLEGEKIDLELASVSREHKWQKYGEHGQNSGPLQVNSQQPSSRE